jgi:hypothetical protein
MSSPYSGEPRTRGPFWLSLAASVAGAALVALLILAGLYAADRYGMSFWARKAELALPATQSKLPLQTEVFFLNGLKSQPVASDEWWAARSDHRLLAYAVLTCKQLPEVTLDAMPRQFFSALLLDLAPTGNHVFLTKDGEDNLLASRDKEAKPFLLSSTDQDLLSISDSIARSRLAAADGANSNVPWVQRLGLTTLIISALATLFVTLQGKTRAVELTDDEQKTLDRDTFWKRFRYVLTGPGSGFRWVAFLAITLSITGTSLTGLKQVYDPTRILTQNTRALLDLRQLHQEVILGIKCDSGNKRVAADSRIPGWTAAIRRIRATIIPEYGAYANLDVGGTAPRGETPPQETPAPPTPNPTPNPAPGGGQTP